MTESTSNEPGFDNLTLLMCADPFLKSQNYEKLTTNVFNWTGREAFIVNEGKVQCVNQNDFTEM